LADGTLNGVEALLRWHHPVLGTVPPVDFIPLAEKTGLILSIGQWVLQTAAQTAVAWNYQREQAVKVSVNISTAQFRADNFLAILQQILTDTGCLPQWLEFEVTESLLLNNDCMIQRLFEHLRWLGITIAIDDFGTGYSALSYLHQFAIDGLKIDRQFVKELEQSTRQRELFKVIVAIAAAFELELVAEGIETTEQAELLSEFGCSLGQGYLFGRPVPRQQFEDAWF
jgi:EAL domain-containing protein (putative c-di-GMP-specific phosphodiesterase class I)